MSEGDIADLAGFVMLIVFTFFLFVMARNV